MNGRRGAAGRDDGTAMVLALLFTTLLLMVATGLILVASIDRTIAGNYRADLEGQYAAEAIAGLAVHGLAAIGDWSSVLNGFAKSPWVDGPSFGTRVLSDGSSLDLNQVVNTANCGKVTAC